MGIIWGSIRAYFGKNTDFKPQDFRQGKRTVLRAFFVKDPHVAWV